MTVIKNKDELYALAERDLLAGSDHVSINREVLKTMQPGDKPMSLMGAGLQGRPVGEKLEDAVAYILTLNAINWMFWDRSTDGTRSLKRYTFEKTAGAVAMRKAVALAWGDDPSPTTFIAALNEKGVTGIFGDISNPLQRELCLVDVLGENLPKAVRAVCDAVGSSGSLSFEQALELQRLFPVAYRDIYLKREQLALAEIAGHLAEQGTKVELDVTAFADYQVPRVLRGIGILEYSKELAERVDGYDLIAADSRVERAIRGATILACREMADVLGTTDAAIDNYLWTKRNEIGDSPFHLTVTTDY